MFRKFKLYSLNPFLAGFLLLSAIAGASYPSGGYHSYSDEDILINLKTVDSENDQSAFISLLLDRELHDLVLDDSDHSEYELLAFPDEFLIQRRSEDSSEQVSTKQRKKAYKRVASYELSHTDFDAPANEEAEWQGVNISINRRANGTKHWSRLLAQEDSYFRFSESKKGNQIHLEPIPDSGLSASEIDDEDIFILFHFEDDIAHMEIVYGKDLKAEAKAKPSQSRRQYPKPSLIKPTTAPRTTNAAAHPATAASRPTPTAPLPTETEVDLSYLDRAYAQGFFDDPINVIVPSYDAGLSYGFEAVRERDAELTYMNGLSLAELAEYQPTSHMLMFYVDGFWVEDFGDFAICHFTNSGN
ncbi:MAG: hypothetical protein Q4P72_03060 [Eubacteriales bacterium]|nr:hypothetical protein [Eubacteriales bacterium]